MLTAPNSLTTTAVLAPSGRASNSRINVVLPAPRNPVTTVTGMRAPRGRRCRRPNGLASLPAKGSVAAGGPGLMSRSEDIIPPHPGPLPVNGERESLQSLPRIAVGAFALQPQLRSLSPHAGRGTG